MQKGWRCKIKKLFVLFLSIVALSPLNVNAECSKKVADIGFINETLDVYLTADTLGPKPNSLNDWCYDEQNNHLFIVINYKNESKTMAKFLAKSIGQDMIQTSKTMRQVNKPLSLFQKKILSKGITVIITWPGREDSAAWEFVRGGAG
jgi:hypothetical protein